MARLIVARAIRKPAGLVHATGIVMMATLLSAVFGLLREMLLASHFGATTATDAYFFSYELSVSLPEFLIAAIAAGLVPVYTRAKKEEHSTAFVSTVLNSYLLGLLAVGALVLVSAPGIVATLASGFDDAGKETATRILRLLAPVIVMTGMWGCFRTLLNAEREFFISTISQIFLSLGIIGAILLYSDRLGIYSLPLGILVGSLVQMLWTGYFMARQRAFRYRTTIDLNDPYFRRFLALLGPGIAGGLIGYTNQLVDKAFASHLAEGSIAALSFAARPMAILTRIYIYSFVTALIPTLSWQAIHRDPASYRQSVVQTLQTLMFFVTPVSLLLAVLSRPIIELLYERGRFDAGSTSVTAACFAALVIGLAPMAVAVTLSIAFTSLEDTRTPAIFGAGTNLVSNIGFDLLLIGILGAAGIALASSLKYVVSGTVLFVLFRRRLGGIELSHVGYAFGKTFLASILAVSPVVVLTHYSNLTSLAVVLVGVALSGMLYWMLSAVMGVPELKLLHVYLGQLMDRGKSG